MNLPNQLTVSRFALTAVFLVAMFVAFPGHETAALLLFSAASLTDYFDGRIARERKLITDFGILMDPLADKILICSAFIAFVGRHLMPAWMVVLIVARELAITGLRLLAANKQVVLAAERFGKHKTISQIVAIIAVLLLDALDSGGDVIAWVLGPPILGGNWLQWLVVVSQWAAVLFTVFSGGVYLWRNRRLYLDDV
ncbi:MAG: CDP-diacylglycerol--glycerol-3-phosphate 3-phosphatidyltransferase [Verrucomicrobiales bacterium]|nr:CDP-diacylglycerol--glycerol-3-phosphate 3-phosphatidyltransferase [Verrucomicrobiales bacterium]